MDLKASFGSKRKGKPVIRGGLVRRGLPYWLIGWSPSTYRNSLCVFPAALLLIPLIGGSPVKNKACPELNDPEALRAVRTVCLDTSNLRTEVASAVSAFAGEQDQPGRPLNQINWELTDECATADAVIRVYFVPSEFHVAGENEGWSESATQVVLLVYDRASIRLLYRTEVHVAGKKPAVLLKRPFSRLVKDMNELAH
ncbi:MAG TPA: hypothetical protein VI455_18980 [Terriglobia bacterium]